MENGWRADDRRQTTATDMRGRRKTRKRSVTYEGGTGRNRGADGQKGHIADITVFNCCCERGGT